MSDPRCKGNPCICGGVPLEAVYLRAHHTYPTEYPDGIQLGDDHDNCCEFKPEDVPAVIKSLEKAYQEYLASKKD